MRAFSLLLAALPVFTNAAMGEALGVHRELSGIDGSYVEITTGQSSQNRSALAPVSVCSSTPQTHRSAKGFSTGSNHAPFAQPGETRCLALAPTLHRFVLLSKASDGHARRSLAFGVDLTGYSGRVLNITWISEALD